jgi:threonine dehydratase
MAGVLVRTPLLESERLNRRLHGRLLLKAEGLQVTGSFKARGAWNCMTGLAQRGVRGVVAYSAGNHGQGVAWAAAKLSMAACIVMPNDAPAVKIDRTRAWGADIVLYDRYSESREEISEGIAAEHGYSIVKPFDDPAVIAGAGTLGLEALEQARALGAEPDGILVPCSGGGLLAGCAIAWRRLAPDAEVWGIEPHEFDDTLRSFQSGRLEANAPDRRSICDALVGIRPGKLTFDINRRLVSGILTVTDAEVLGAMRIAADELRVVVEPGGAVALAAVLNGRIDLEGRTVLAVLSGANADLPLLASSLAD